MVDYSLMDLFLQTSVDKQFKIISKSIWTDDVIEITNDHLYDNELSLTESLCSQEELKFGSCEASQLKFKCRNEFGNLTYEWLDASIIPDGHTEAPFKLGSYKVFSSEPSGDRAFTDIVAYDIMYSILNADVTRWYNSRPFPMTLKDFRDSFFDDIEIDVDDIFRLHQEETTLINDHILIEKTIDSDNISGKDIITVICEMNGVFGHIDREGIFRYVSLGSKTINLLPSTTLYPDTTLFPGTKTDANLQYYEIDPSNYISCEYKDFETQFITGVRIRKNKDGEDVFVGTTSNIYTIEDNFITHGKRDSELRVIASRLLAKIEGVQYRPFKSTLQGNPCLEVGDCVQINSPMQEIKGYVLERKLNGIQALRDSFEANGVSVYPSLSKTSGGGINLTSSNTRQTSNGVSGSFTTTDGKTITITNGIVTSIY